MNDRRPAPDTHDTSEAMLTVDELAGRWKVSPRTVIRVLQRGEFPYFRIGRQIRIRVSDILNFEKKNMK
jgi:excisionase family DNA binding protein